MWKKYKKTVDEKTQVFIVQGSVSHLKELLIEEMSPDDDDEYETCWTCPKAVKAGDLMLIYLMAPLSAIVGYAYFTGEPYMNNDSASDWFGKTMAAYDNLTMLDPHDYLGLGEMRLLFPEWHWVHRPQGATVVPDKPEMPVKKPLLERLLILNSANEIGD